MLSYTKNQRALPAIIIKTSLVTLFSLGLLSGCSRKNAELGQIKQGEYQLEEMATVIAGGEFLAQQCQEPNMVSGSALQQRVVDVAKIKGLNVEAYLDPASDASKQLAIASNYLYKQIIDDPNSTLPYNINKNCYKLKQMLAPFL